MDAKKPDPIRASINPRIRFAGAFVGVLGACAVVLLAPYILRVLGVPIRPAWGMGTFAAPACLLGAIPGYFYARWIFQWGGSFGLIG